METTSLPIVRHPTPLRDRGSTEMFTLPPETVWQLSCVVSSWVLRACRRSSSCVHVVLLSSAGFCVLFCL